MAVAILLAGAAALWIGAESPRSMHARPAEQRPRLMLLTALPLVFPEQFTLEGGGSPALDALERRYRVEPISIADAGSLGSGGLLLMAQPLAQPAEVLVELDQWIRSGGQLLLLADPALDWPSERPLGDKFRPPPAFADTGLLSHWGLTLYAPETRGHREVQIGGIEVKTASPGTIEGACPRPSRGVVARCRIGKGEATVIADADFLNVGQLQGDTSRNLDALLAELAELER